MLSAVCNAVLGPCAVSVILYEHWGANIRQLLSLNFNSWQPIEWRETQLCLSPLPKKIKSLQLFLIWLPVI